MPIRSGSRYFADASLAGQVRNDRCMVIVAMTVGKLRKLVGKLKGFEKPKRRAKEEDPVAKGKDKREN